MPLKLGDLINEDEVLNWLIEQKSTATIEEVTDEILKGLVEEHEYVLVYFSKYCNHSSPPDNWRQYWKSFIGI